MIEIVSSSFVQKNISFPSIFEAETSDGNTIQFYFRTGVLKIIDAKTSKVLELLSRDDFDISGIIEQAELISLLQKSEVVKVI